MSRRSILQKNRGYLLNKKLYKPNEPKQVELKSRANNELSDILVEVEEEVTAMQPIMLRKDGINIKSPIFGVVKTIEEHQDKDSTYSFTVAIENSFKKVEPLKKLIKPTKTELLKRIEEANVIELLELNNKKNLCINLKDNKFTLGLNEFLLQQFASQILKGTQFIKKAFEQETIFILHSKKQKETLQKQIEKLNLKGIQLVLKTNKSMTLLNAQTAIDFYEAVNSGILRTDRIVALSGESLLKPAYYLVKLGTPLRELIELSGGLKHTYDEIEAYKEEAQMAVFDQIQIKKEIKQEKDKQKRQELKTLLKTKTDEAQQFIFNHFKEEQKKYGLCLSKMVFLETNGWYDANSLSNSIEHTTNAVLFLSNRELKNKTIKK